MLQELYSKLQGSDVYLSKQFPPHRQFVTDLNAAVKFYPEVLGWYLIMSLTTISDDDSAIGVMCTDVFCADWTSFRIAHLYSVAAQRRWHRAG